MTPGAGLSDTDTVSPDEVSSMRMLSNFCSCCTVRHVRVARTGMRMPGTMVSMVRALLVGLTPAPSGTRTISGVASRTVGSGTTSTYVPLSGNESLWYDLPVKGSANFGSTGSDNLGWHVVSDVDEDVVIPPTWLMVITRNSFAGSNMYLWGDMRSQTP